MTLSIKAGSVLLAFGLLSYEGASAESDYLNMPPLGVGWKVARQQSDANRRMREFVRDGESLNNWTENISWESFRKGPTAPSETVVNGKRDFLKQFCGDLMWNTIKREEGLILYEWRISDCKPPSRSDFDRLNAAPGARLDPNVQLEQLFADQHSISLFIEGKWTVWHISYVIKVKEISDEKRTEWIKRFSDARVGIEPK